jgi:hypothetical protein
MAEPAPLRHRYSYAEYLAYEQDSGLKHEYDNGEILAMAGGSRRHNALALRVGAVLDAGREHERGIRYRHLPSGSWEYSEATEGIVQLSTGAALELVKLYEQLPV